MIYWHEQALTFPCDVCTAEPGEECRTATGRPKTEVHASRGRQADRCPKCGARLLGEQVPGDLCGRCEQVRALEIERATYHVRKDR